MHGSKSRLYLTENYDDDDDNDDDDDDDDKDDYSWTQSILKLGAADFAWK